MRQSAASESDGFHTWTIDEVRQFEAHHPIGTTPRLAFALLLYTGQRRSDVVHLGRQHLREGRLTYANAMASAPAGNVGPCFRTLPWLGRLDPRS